MSELVVPEESKNLSPNSSPGSKSSASGHNPLWARQRNYGYASSPITDSDSKSDNFNLEESLGIGSKTTLGFWTYLMTDLILFATLFATYAVLHGNTFGGPSGQDLFSLPFVLTETLILLTSSFVCGLAVLAARRGAKALTLALLGVTFLLGAAFLTLEISEFNNLVQEGNSWRRSGFLSSFFTLVGTHGLHITAGLLWMLVMGVHVVRRGLTVPTLRRLTLLGMFWHFLDVVWIFIFTIVYLLGVI